jgi:hypothetical protein
MEGLVKRDLGQLDELLASLDKEHGVEIFSMNEDMLVRSVQLLHLGLQPFDQAILASILVKAETLKKNGIERFSFCEADSDLQPSDKLGAPKEPLLSIYDQAAIWVYQDFLLQEPQMPANWPAAES